MSKKCDTQLSIKQLLAKAKPVVLINLNVLSLEQNKTLKHNNFYFFAVPLINFWVNDDSVN